MWIDKKIYASLPHEWGGQKQNPLSEPGRETVTLEREKTKEPRLYAVIMYNDDYTTQDFVVHVLIQFFHKNEAQATHLMRMIHTQDKAKIGVYPKDIAESKVTQVLEYARQNEMPLLLTAEQE